METILNKSKENSVSFQVLKRSHRYNSCVHCAYYSAFQLSIYSLCGKFKIPFEKLCNDDMAKIGKPKGASHVKTIEELRATIFNYNKSHANSYYNCMNNLRCLRVVADYSKDNITHDDIVCAEQLLSEVTKLLKENYIC